MPPRYSRGAGELDAGHALHYNGAMKTKLTASLVMVLAVLLGGAGLPAGCSAVRVEGSGNVISRTFDFADFSRVTVFGGLDADVKAGSAFRVEVTTDDNLFPYVVVRKNGDTLEIGMRSGSFRPTRQQTTVSMPDLGGLRLSDGSKVTISGFESSTAFAATLTDGSGLSGRLKARDVSLTLHDGSRVELEGSAQSLKIVSRDGSRCTLEDFVVVNADLDIGNGGTAGIRVTGTLNASLDDGSRVTYAGSPTLGTITLTHGATLSRED